jgi:hypothetical protein
MEELKQLAFRVPASMLEQIDAYVDFLREQTPGLAATRTDAVRVLLAQALSNFEASQTATKSKRK